MSNILAITHKELKSYFASPIAYVVIGLYALVFGYYFYAAVRFFDRQSMQMMGLGAGPPSVNINEQLIRPVFQYSMVVFLIVLPMITMRTYSEEKRSGTMELLLTSPLTDFQIIMGKFLGAMGLYAAMLGVTVLHMALLFWVSNPEWMPIVTSYLGLLLMGGCFMSVGLLISSFTKNQIVAVVATFAVFMMLWMINWIASVHGTDGAGGAQLHVDHRPPRGLHGRRHRHQAPGLLRQLHRIRAVPDRPVGGHRTVEGLTMVQRILGILSWVGVALVFGALVVRFTKPEWDQYATWAAWAGLGLVVLYTLGQWRDIVAFFRRRNARYGTIAGVSVIVVLGILVAVNYLSDRRNKRWDLTENKQYSLSEQSTKLLASLQSPAKFMVFDQATSLDRFRAAARCVRSTARTRSAWSTSTSTRIRSGPRSTRSTPTGRS